MHPPHPPATRGPDPLAARVVVWCWRHGAVVALLAALLAVAAGWLAVTRLSLDTDETHMIAADLPYRQAERRFDQAFPHTMDRLVVVVDAATPERADAAAAILAERLARQDGLFLSVQRPPAELFFRRHALLFLPEAELRDLAERLIRAQPLLGGLAADPSLRGLLMSLSLMLLGVERGDIGLADIEPALASVAELGESVLAGQPRPLSWQALVTGRAPDVADTRRFVITQPRLDHARMVPGEEAARAIRNAAKGLDARVRLTGPVALTDDNFRTVVEGAGLAALVSIALVCALLLLAVGSLRIAAAILATLLAGLLLTSAFAALAVGVLNPISVAFVALFVGLAVDFGIQFAIRFRDEHFQAGGADPAMRHCARVITRPLLVVAAAIAAGFLSFLPTDYVGVSQLGLIAGGGMVIGVALTLTLLPALLGLLRPPPERAPPGFTVLAPLDGALRRHAVAVLAGVAAVALVSAALALRLSFDFDPLHLQDPQAESVAVFRELAATPETSPYLVNLLAPSQAEADGLAARLEGRPGVAFAMTLSGFIPEGQAAKLAIIADLDQLLGESLYPAFPPSPPTAGETRAAMVEAAQRLDAVGAKSAARLAAVLRQVAERGRDEDLARAVTAGLPHLLDLLRQMLDTAEIAPGNLPADLRRDWIGVNGEARVQVHPGPKMTGPAAMRQFVESVRAVSPEASGPPVAIVDSGRVVVRAFAQAGAWALAAVAVLLAVVLRRLGDALLVLAPLAVGGLVTAAAMATTGLSVNFANIIAFPLLLGIGVAYNVYFVINWRAARGPLLPSSTARAVLFSALTTGVAFGALALSPHRGTASMGLVLMLSLVLMVLASFIVLPAAFALIERAGRRP